MLAEGEFSLRLNLPRVGGAWSNFPLQLMETQSLQAVKSKG